MKRFGPRQQAAAAAALAAPVAVVGLLAEWTGGFSAGQTAILCAGAAAAVGGLAWRWLGEVREVVDYLHQLGTGRDPVVPPLETEAAREVVATLARIHRDWRGESREHVALAASHETTLDSIPDPLLLLDEHRRVVAANVASRSLLGREPLRLDIGSLLRVPALLDAIDRALAGHATDEVEFSLPLPLERSFVARLRRLPVLGVGGARLVLAVHDVTAIRRSEQMRAEFVANASHELRTPLAGLLGYIETLAGPARDDAAARERFLPIMQQMATRMARLIEDLLSLSRIEFDEHTQPTTPVAVGEVVRSVADALAPQAKARDMDIVAEVEPGLPQVPGQADQIAQVVQNLVDNAIKYGRPGTRVEVTVRRADRLPPQAARLPAPAVMVAVRDHGEGIAREHLPRLTERFYRCDAARSREMGGTGLGLAIVKHIVNRHRGALVIDSTPGQGSVFTLYLPATGAAA